MTIASAYAVTLSAFLEPLRGVYNRGNLFAAFGYAGLVYALAMTAASLVGGRQQGVRAVAAGMVALIAVGYVVRSRDDVADRQRRDSNSRRSRRQFAPRRCSRAAARSSPSAIRAASATGSRSSTSTGTSTARWRCETNDRSLHAYPVYKSASLVCDRAASRSCISTPTAPPRRAIGRRTSSMCRRGPCERIASVDDCAACPAHLPTGARVRRSD